MEDEYERGRVRGQEQRKKEYERMRKKLSDILRIKSKHINTEERFFPFEAHLKQLHLKYFGYLKGGRNLSKGDISTYHIKEEDGAIAVMHPYLS